MFDKSEYLKIQRRLIKNRCDFSFIPYLNIPNYHPIHLAGFNSSGISIFINFLKNVTKFMIFLCLLNLWFLRGFTKSKKIDVSNLKRKNIWFLIDQNSDSEIANFISTVSTLKFIPIKIDFKLQSLVCDENQLSVPFKKSFSYSYLLSYLKRSVEVFLALWSLKSQAYCCSFLLSEVFTVQSLKLFLIKCAIKDLLLQLEPEVVGTTIEGNCIEDLIFRACIELDSANIRFVGYQHTVLFPDYIGVLRLQHTVKFNELWCTGITTAEIMTRFIDADKIKVVGDFRPTFQSLLPKPKKTNIYFIIDGETQVAEKMLSILLKLSNMNGEVDFTYRLHPRCSISKKINRLLKQLSDQENVYWDKNVQPNLNLSQYAVFHNSILIFEALNCKLYPVYLNINEFSSNPLEIGNFSYLSYEYDRFPNFPFIDLEIVDGKLEKNRQESLCYFSKAPVTTMEE